MQQENINSRNGRQLWHGNIVTDIATVNLNIGIFFSVNLLSNNSYQAIRMKQISCLFFIGNWTLIFYSFSPSHPIGLAYMHYVVYFKSQSCFHLNFV